MLTELVLDSSLNLAQRRPDERYLILSLPRTGSSLLADGLSQTGLAGVPMEYLNEQAVAEIRAQHGVLGVETHLAEISLRRTTPNGLFGLKLHYYQLAGLYMTESGLTAEGRRFLDSFSKVILMYRRDVLLQAISLVLAFKTDLWHSEDPAHENARQIDVDEATIVDISHHLAFLLSDLRASRALIRDANLTAIEVCYEDLIASYDAELNRVLAFLGQPETQTRMRSVKLGRAAN